MATNDHTALDGKKAREALKQVNADLRIAQAGVVSVTMALLHQRAERDEEFAQVLAHCVTTRLDSQIDRVAGLIGSSTTEEDEGVPQ